MMIQPLVDRVEGRKALNVLFGLYPIYIFFSLTTILYGNYGFIDKLGWLVMPILTAYTVVLMIYNLFAGVLKCDKLLGISVLAFFCLIFLSTIITKERGATALSYAFMIPINGLVLGASWYRIDERERLKPVETCFLIFALLVTLWNVLGLIFKHDMLGTGRYTGLSSNPVRLSDITSIAIIMLVMFVFRSRRNWERIAFAISIIVNAVVMYYANGRGPQLGLLAGLAVFALLMLSKVLKKRTFIIILFLSVAFCLVFGLSIVFSRMDISEFSFDAETLNQLSTKRMSIYRDALSLIIENPFIGHSSDEFLHFESLNHANQFHNLLLDITLRYGIFTLAAFLTFVVALVAYSISGLWKMDRNTLLSYSGLTYLTAFSVFICILVQTQSDTYVFINGYSACNCFFYITAGVMTYWASKRHLETKA